MSRWSVSITLGGVGWPGGPAQETAWWTGVPSAGVSETGDGGPGEGGTKMRLVTYRQGGATRLGAVIGDQVLDLVKRASETNVADWPEDLDMVGLLRLGPPALEKARRVVAAVEMGFRLGGGGRLRCRGGLQ